MFSCYLLELESDKYYAGSTLTHLIQQRYNTHLNGTGAKWTKKYKPLHILKTWDNLTSQEAFKKEQEVCENIILEQGDLDSCRGGTRNFGFVGDFWWVPRSFRHMIPRQIIEQTPI